MIDHDALAELPSSQRQRIIAQLGRMAVDIDLERSGPAARFLASVAATIRKAEVADFLRLDAFEDAINQQAGEIVPDGANPIPDGWELT
jgi:hypothetical protein